MKIPIIKKLVESYSLEELSAAEAALADEQNPEIEVEGQDEGEKLTHAYAAMWIRQKIDQENLEFKEALRLYTQMVRDCIN